MKKSVLEERFEFEVLQFINNKPEQQYRFHASRKWRFDYAWPAMKLAVEIDGGQWIAHGGRHNTDGDREKLNAAAVLGWRVLRYSGAMLARPTKIKAEILKVLGEYYVE